MSDKLKNHELLPQEDLEQVAGGNKTQFNEICKTLHMEGSSPEQVKNFLLKRGIKVKNFNMGHLGGLIGQKDAEYSVKVGKLWIPSTNHSAVVGECEHIMKKMEEDIVTDSEKAFGE